MTLEELWALFPIFLTGHKPEWSQWYSEQEELLFSILPEQEISAISHIGSTAIPSIWAKPIIDILVEIHAGYSLEKLCSVLTANGWILMSHSPNRLSFNRGYTENGFAEKVYHLHLRFSGDNDELYFRDYLIDHPEAAKDYEQLKLLLWKKYEHDRDGYTQAKSSFIRQYTRLAKEMYPARYSRQ